MIVNAVIVLGAVIAGTVAFEPHFSSAYRIQFGVLVASLLPYLLYAAIAASVRKSWIGLVGIGLVVTHALMLARPHLWESVWGTDTAIYGVPLALAILLLPVVYLATKPAWAGKDAG